MSSYFNSYFVEPALRQARRFSSPRRPDDTVGSQPDSATSQSTPQPTDGAVADNETTDAERQSPRRPPPGQIPLGDLREAYNNDADTYRAEEIVPSERDAGVARANGMQGLLPLNDVRSNYVFDNDPVDSPAPLADEENEDTVMGSPRHVDERTLDSFSSMSLGDGPSMTSNPNNSIPSDLMSTGGSSSSMSSRSRRFGSLGGTRGTGSRRGTGSTGGSANLQMSESLPDDDGMRAVRAEMHKIREMALSAEEKARRMHELMTADYAKLRAQHDLNDAMLETSLEADQPKPVQPHDLDVDARSRKTGSSQSKKSASARKGSLSVTPQDLVPSYQRKATEELQASTSRSEQKDSEEDFLSLGCIHYLRKVKVQCPDCMKWFPCRHCHDQTEKHALVRSRIRNMLCMACGTPQRAAEYCSQCSQLTASYYCDICKLWDDDTSHKIYHCPDCGICRRGEGLGKDYVHCKRCNVCINIASATTHRCIERATECDCPICGEWMFTSSTRVVALQCGHYMHRPCHDELMRSSFKCPICNRSAVNMELQWRKLDQAIEAQPMPSQFKETKVWILCNDCSARTCTSFHWLGNKCTECDSYNTNQFKMINSPSDQELQALQDTQSQEVRALRAAEIQMGTQNGNAATNLPPTQTNNGAASVPPSQTTAQDVPIRAAPVPANHDGPSPEQVHDPDQVMRCEQPHYADPVSPPTAYLARPVHRHDSDSYFPATSPDHHGSTTDEHGDFEMTDPSVNGGDEEESQAEGDDVTFWGEPVSPTGWTMPSVSMPQMPQMPRMPSVSMPSVPRPDWPRMPSVSMPNMPSMPHMNMPSMPNMPSVSMPRAISPTTIWAAGSPTFSGWNLPGLPSPRFFPLRRITGQEQGNEDNDNDAGDEGDDDEEGSDSSSSDEGEGGRMDWEGDGEEDADVDDMALFGHR